VVTINVEHRGSVVNIPEWTELQSSAETEFSAFRLLSLASDFDEIQRTILTKFG